MRSWSGDLAGLGLIEPFAVRRLFDRRFQINILQRLEHRRAPQVDVLPEGVVLHPVPLLANDEPGVADELAGELVAEPVRQALGGLDLLSDGQRLGLRSRPRRVVALERQEDEEPEQYGEPGGQHTEDAGRPVTVGVVAAFRRPAPHQQHHGDGERRHHHDDQGTPEQVHVRAVVVGPAGYRGRSITPATWPSAARTRRR